MKRRSDEEISAPLYEYDAAIRAQYGFFAGVDEAGRGPLCGPRSARLPAGAGANYPWVPCFAFCASSLNLMDSRYCSAGASSTNSTERS